MVRDLPLFTFFILIGSIFITGCIQTARTQRVDLDTELIDDSYGTSVQDYRTVSDQMARSLIQLPMIHQALTPPTIAFIEVENRTNNFIDTIGFQEKIRTKLLKNARGKLRFLDRYAIKEILKERKRKARGYSTASEKSANSIFGADYFLTGSIHSNNHIKGSQRTEYIRYSFRLTDADTSLIVWEDEYETRTSKVKDMRDR